MKRLKYLKKYRIVIPIITLLVLSLLNMYGASSITNLYKSALNRQALWIFLGIIVTFLTIKANMSFILKHSRIFYYLGCLSLLLVLFFGKNINGATSWFKIGPFSFQPSELFKAFFILYIAHSIGESKKKDFRLFLKIILATFLPCILIFLEPDTGVVMMYMLMTLGALLSSGIPKKYTAILLFSGTLFLVAFLGLYFLNGELFTKIFGISFFYRMDRLLSFKNASSYQLEQALIGIGSSGVKGFGLKSSKVYIPEATTDFVFALSICNFGIIIGIVIVILYAWILYEIWKSGKNAKKMSEKCISYGIFAMMAFQVGEHILMNLGLTPITGITLPFLSYGGSSLLSYFMLIGLILKITTNNSSYS